MVKVEGQSEGDTDDNNLHPAVRRQRSQGSIFAKEMFSYVHRPLPPTPAQDAVYYKTVNYPLGHVPTTRKVWHHEYIEIDESKFNQQKGKGALPKAAEGWINIHAAGGPVRVGDRKKRSLTNLPPPPPVPRRPSCPYVEIDGDKIEELAASLPSVSRFGVGAGPKFARKLGPPPAVPGRPEETIRQRSLSNSGEYSYPAIPGLMFEWLNRKRGEGSKAYFTPRVPLLSSSKPLHHSGKKSLMETITEKGFASNPPPTVPPKTESLLREQMRLLANQPSRTRPSPYLVPVTSVRKASSYDHLPSGSAYLSTTNSAEITKEVVSNLRKELLAGKTNEEDYKPDKSSALPLHLMERKKTMLPPSLPLPYQISVEAKEKALSSNPPKVPMKKKKVSSDTNGEKTDARHVESGAEKDESLNSTDSVALRKARLQDRIDRNSLAMIMQNKSAIEEKLEKEHGSPKARRKQLAAAREPAPKEDESLVRSLGDILLDVDALLQNRMCSEDDLIAAIETRLNIKLVKKATEESNKEDEKDDGSSQRLEDSVQVTEEDVKEVVQFMNNSHGTQPENEGEEMFERSMIVKMTQEEETSEHEALGSPKPRSSTVIIIDDAPELKEKGGRFLTERAELSPDTWDGREHMMDNEGEEEEEGTKMRDSRSLSVGLKPFRRVKVRRRTNAASDMANLSVSTNHFTQGTGEFNSKGGTLTNLTSEVEIEVPKGAVPPGKRQRLWFEVIQKIYDPSEENKEISFQDLSQKELSDSNLSVDEVGNLLSERRKRIVQLSTMVLIGPSDAKFEQPIKIKMPHCLPYRNNSWHLHLQARAQNCESDDWLELSNSSGLIIPQSRQSQRFFKNSTYQMHLHYAVVRTREMGCFKLCGSPMRNGSHSAKRMVASIFGKKEGGKAWSVLVTLSNAIHDQIQALDLTQRNAGYTSLEHSVPVLCFGEGKDMELSLCTESNSLPLATQVIQFGQFWRLKRVGQARAIFPVSLDQVESSQSKTLTLKIQQAGSQLLHETNFVLAD